MNNYTYLGVVRRGGFVTLQSDDPTVRTCQLTAMPVGDPGDPATAAIPLAQYEGSVLMVRGFFADAWIRGAVIVEQAGPILSAVTVRSFQEVKP